MTSKASLGESKGGEGRAKGPTVTDLIGSALDTYRKDGRPIRTLEVQRVTEDMVSLRVHIHGEPEPEELTYFDY